MSASDPAKLITKADELCVFLSQHFSSLMILTTNFFFFLKLTRTQLCLTRWSADGRTATQLFEQAGMNTKLTKTQLCLIRWSADRRTATQLFEQAGMNTKLQIHVQSQIQFVVYEFYIFF